MTARLRGMVLGGCLLATLTACPAPGTPSVDPPARTSSAAPPLPALGTDASVGLPAYAGPPSGGPRSGGPVSRVRAAVDLTPAADGSFSQVRLAVAGPDGEAFVVLSPSGDGHPERLGTVRRGAGGYRVTSSMPLPLTDVWGLHHLIDGRVVATGPLDPLDGTPQDYGFVVADPATGAVRTTVIVPFGPPPSHAVGRSALAGDGRTLFLFLSLGAGAGPRERLVSADALTGTVLSDRDLSSDIAAASRAPAAHDVAGLVPRPSGGVTLVLDAAPDSTLAGRIPTLLTYDAELAPVGGPVRVTTLAEGAQTQATAAGSDGTVFLVVAVPGGAWILAVPDAGGAGPVLAQLPDALFVYSLVVEPAQVWALLPAPTGARAVDLTTGKLRNPIDLGCPRPEVRAMFPGSGGVGALLVGACNDTWPRTQMLWILGP